MAYDPLIQKAIDFLMPLAGQAAVEQGIQSDTNYRLQKALAALLTPPSSRRRPPKRKAK